MFSVFAHIHNVILLLQTTTIIVACAGIYICIQSEQKKNEKHTVHRTY